MVQTSGKVHQSPGNVRITEQPDLKNGYIWRKSGVDRKSARVEMQNKKFAKAMAGNKMAHECGHKGPHGGPTPRKQFFSCLRVQGDKFRPQLSGGVK